MRMLRDERLRKATGHWVEHKHRVYGHMFPWLQAASSGTAAQQIVARCAEYGFQCMPHEEEMFSEPRRPGKHSA